jgi:multidrug transporter EmrE-like cation transporter
LTLKDLGLCVACAIALPIGQTFFKWAAVYNAQLTGPLVMRLATNYPLIGAFAWYGVTALVWFYTLTRVPLSIAYPFSLMGSALVPLVGWFVFKEPVDWRFSLGFALMLVGLLVIMLGQPRS